MKYEYVELTADIGVKASGKDLKESFEAAALAVFNLITDAKRVKDQEIKLVTKKAHDLKALLYDFIGEIIYLHDAEGLVFSKVKIEELDEKNNTIKAVFKGEQYDQKKHKAGTYIKAITYHNMKIEQKKSGIDIEFTLDV